jgi:prepilin-type N-terminal cleavage/methylation domain-containing protein
MSEIHANTNRSGSDRRDQGMTLLELVITLSLIGIITTVLSSAIVVTLRQQDNSLGRLNVAREEQQVGLWVPADLSSANTVDTSPWLTPCGATVCDGIDLSTGSNVLLLTWSTDNGDGTATTTNVSYHFAPSDKPGLFQLSRVECMSTDGATWTCTSRVVLRDLPGPPAGDDFVPGVANGENCNRAVDPIPCTRPTWVITVSEPLAPDAVDQTQLADASDRKDANRVIVSINGGGDSAGAGGGANQVSLTAGGTSRTTIDAKSSSGTPSFVEARSRCGGPMTLVVDESNSIGSSITQVKAGVRDFINALAGTPVKLQIVRFQTTSSILGSSDWHHYFDMTNQADVNTLLAAVDGLQGSWSTNPLGGTNWEEALFRTFYEADGSTAAVIPKSMVLFTDGVPTFDRLVQRTPPGILPVQPAAPGLPWPASTGSNYSQVAFDRADFIANAFRTNVRFVGVGVGSGITQNSNWIIDPGKGYRDVVERGSYSYAHQVVGYQARYQKKNSSNGSWYWVDLPTYNSAASNRRQDLGWTDITTAEYNAIINTKTTDDANDGRRTVINLQPVSTAEYNAHSTDPTYVPVAKTWNNGPDWEVWTGAQTGSSTQYRTSRVYNQPPYTGYDAAVTQPVLNSKILARLIAGNDFGTPAQSDATGYTNSEIADMYVLPQWSQFRSAMQAVALGDCGGTLTLSTKVNGTGAAQDPFRYQTNAITDSAGAPVSFEPSVVVTNQQFVTGTFDFPVPNGQFVTVDVIPQNYNELSRYTPGSWSCRAGNTDKAFSLIDIPEAGNWKGVRVRIAANEAVSCQLAVTK